MESPEPHTLGCKLLNYGLMVDRSSSLWVEILVRSGEYWPINLERRSTIVRIFYPSLRTLVGFRMLLMSSKFLVHCKDCEIISTKTSNFDHCVG